MSYVFRIIADNKTDTATSITATSAQATLPVTNLQVADRKVWRSTSAVAQTLTLTWTTAVWIGGVALYRHNLTSDATWRLQLYSDIACTLQVYDSGTVAANPPKTLGELDWGVDPLGATIFTGWDYAFASMWITPITAKGAKITLTDTSNPAGYLQAARLFVGPYLEATYGMSYGVQWSRRESTKQWRTEGGTLRSDNPASFRALSFSLDLFPNSDRTKLGEILRTNGMRKDMFLATIINATGSLERDYTMVAKLTQMPQFNWQAPTAWSTSLQFEEA